MTGLTSFAVSDTGPIQLSVNAVNEYGGVYGEQGVKECPTLLVSAKISEGGWRAEDAPTIGEMRKLNYRFGGRLAYYSHNPTNAPGFSDHHASQFVVYFTIQNLHQDEDGSPNPAYGNNYFWFGIKAFDSREPEVIEKKIAADVIGENSTDKLMIDVGINALAPEVSFHDGESHIIEGDLLPLIKEAVELGYIESPDFSHHKIGTMNFGWEVPALDVVSFRTDELSLVTEYDLRERKNRETQGGLFLISS